MAPAFLAGTHLEYLVSSNILLQYASAGYTVVWEFSYDYRLQNGKWDTIFSPIIDSL